MIYEALKNDYKKFLVEKNGNLKDCVQLVLSDIKQYNIDNRKDVTDEVCLSILNKNIKQIEEAVVFMEGDNRIDLLELYNERINYLKKYLPKMLSDEEVKKEVYDILSKESNLNKGSAMKLVIPVLKSKADGKIISKFVDEFLSE